MNKSNPLAECRPARPSNPLEIVYRRIDQLQPDPANPRVHSRKQIRQIAQSGIVTPTRSRRGGS
jgi:hypothetical protein